MTSAQFSPLRTVALLLMLGVVFSVSAQTVDIPLMYKNAVKVAEDQRKGGLQNVQNIYAMEITPFKTAYDAGLASAKKKKDDALSTAQTLYNTQRNVAESISDPKLKELAKTSAKATLSSSQRIANQTYSEEVKSVKAGFEAQKKAPTDKLATSKLQAQQTYTAKKTALDKAFTTYKIAMADAEAKRKTARTAPETAYKNALKNAEEARNKTISDAQKALEVAKNNATLTYNAEKTNAEQALKNATQGVNTPYADAKKSAEDNFRITTGIYR